MTGYAMLDFIARQPRMYASHAHTHSWYSARLWAIPVGYTRRVCYISRCTATRNLLFASFSPCLHLTVIRFTLRISSAFHCLLDRSKPFAHSWCGGSREMTPTVAARSWINTAVRMTHVARDHGAQGKTLFNCE